MEACRWPEGLWISLQSLLEGSPQAFFGWVVVCVYALGEVVVTGSGVHARHIVKQHLFWRSLVLQPDLFISFQCLPLFRNLGFDCCRSTRSVFNFSHGVALIENDRRDMGRECVCPVALVSATQLPWGCGGLGSDTPIAEPGKPMDLCVSTGVDWTHHQVYSWCKGRHCDIIIAIKLLES